MLSAKLDLLMKKLDDKARDQAFIRNNHVFVVCRSGVKFPKGNIEEPLRPSWYLVRPSRLRGDRDRK